MKNEQQLQDEYIQIEKNLSKFWEAHKQATDGEFNDSHVLNLEREIQRCGAQLDMLVWVLGL